MDRAAATEGRAPLADRLAALLDAEREAALAADVDALVALQEEKRAALDAFGAGGAPEAEVEALAQRARSNLALMRHLAECLRGLATSANDGTYAPDGSLNARPGRVRGAL